MFKPWDQRTYFMMQVSIFTLAMITAIISFAYMIAPAIYAPGFGLISIALGLSLIWGAALLRIKRPRQ